MPDFGAWLSALIKAIGTDVATAFLGKAAVGTTLHTAIAWATQAIIVGVPLYFSARAMMPKVPDLNALMSRGSMFRNPITSRKIIYGEAKVGGPILFIAEGEYEPSVTDRGLLFIVMGLAGHECDEISTVYFNDDELTINTDSHVTDPFRYYPDGSPRATIIRTMLGTSTQTLNSVMYDTTDLTSADQFKGICCLQIILGYDPEVWVSGAPNISAIVKGVNNIYDPRDSSTGYSSNPALCLRDYMINTVYGMGISATLIDDTMVSAAANVCDESVSLDGGGTQDRYTCNGVLDQGNNYQNNIEIILNSMSGFMVYSNGVFKMFAGEYRSPTITISEDDLAGPLNVVTKPSKRDMFNTVRGIATGEWSNYQPTNYPEVQDSAAVTTDGGELVAQLPLFMTNDSTMCQRIAKIFLKRSRQELVLNLSLKLSKFSLEPGDTVTVTLENLGIVDKVFEVISWTFGVQGSETDGMSLGVDTQLKEIDSTVYDWSTSEQVDPVTTPNLTITNPTDVSAPAFSLTQTQGMGEDGSIIDQVEINITDPTTDKFVYEYIVAFKKSTDSTFDSVSVLRE